MPLTKQKKHEVVKKLSENLSKSTVLIFTHFAKISVEKMKGLRKELRAREAGYSVVKKSLLRNALKGANIDAGSIDLKGARDSVGVAYGSGDQVASTRTVWMFSKAKDNESFKVLGGIFDGGFVESQKLAALAKMSSRDELYARLLGQMKAPLSGLVLTLNAIAQKRQAS